MKKLLLLVLLCACTTDPRELSAREYCERGLVLDMHMTQYNISPEFPDYEPIYREYEAGPLTEWHDSSADDGLMHASVGWGLCGDSYNVHCSTLQHWNEYYGPDHGVAPDARGIICETW